MKTELPPYDKVFFVHYQCDNFNEGEQIKSLYILAKGEVKGYFGNELDNIKEYSSKVNELLSSGLILVHWNQDRPHYGTAHINKRYKDLTGHNLELEYTNEINLAEWLIFLYGSNYIGHPRLDNLAKLNEFHGIREAELGQRTFATNRLLLLTKIYFNALNGTLKTEITPNVKTLPPTSTETNEERKRGRTQDPEIQKRNLDIYNAYVKHIKVERLPEKDALDMVFKSFKRKFTGEPKNIKDQIRRIIKATQSDIN